LPFSLLGTCVSLEAILVASFILMRQARLARSADERDHLMLQILLLTEKEITAVVQMDRQIAAKVGLTRTATDKDIEELGQKNIDRRSCPDYPGQSRLTVDRRHLFDGQLTQSR